MALQPRFLDDLCRHPLFVETELRFGRFKIDASLVHPLLGEDLAESMHGTKRFDMGRVGTAFWSSRDQGFNLFVREAPGTSDDRFTNIMICDATLRRHGHEDRECEPVLVRPQAPQIV